MAIIRLLLPYLFVIFFVYKGTKESIYFLGIPFLMFMSNSIFFDTAKAFHYIPAGLEYDLPSQFIWLVFMWILSKAIHKNNEIETFGHNRQLIFVDYCIISLIIVAIIGLITTIIEYPIETEVDYEFLTQMSLFAGYFFMRNWFLSSNPETSVNFLYSLV